MHWPKLFSDVEERARSLGFDLVGALRVGAYNRVVDEGARISDLGDSRHLALVVGNTKTLWPVFIRHLQQNAELIQQPDPLDRYVEERLSGLFAALPVRAELRWAHKPEPAHVSMQTLAQLAGIGYKTDSHLVIHPEYGPWVGLRAVAVLPVVGPAEVFQWNSAPCAACSTGCKPALAAAIAGQENSSHSANVSDKWTSWLAVRDACPLGRAHRYSEDQIRYHYTKDTRLLEKAVAE